MLLKVAVGVVVLVVFIVVAGLTGMLFRVWP
jgi:hypothetical protein